MALKTGIYQKYKNIYYYYFPRNGKQTSVSTGKTNRKDADEWVKLNFPSSVQHYKVTIQDYFNIYNEYLEANKSPNTITLYKNALKLFSQINKKVYLKDINSQDLEDFKVTLVNDKIKKRNKTTIGMYLRALKSCLTYAFDHNYIGVNPGLKVKSFKEPEKEVLSFTDEQVKTILENADDNIKQIIRFALLTGMRLREISNCKFSDIKGDILTIGNKKDFNTKSKLIRRIAVSRQLKELINSLDRNNEYLFNYKDAVSISKLFKKLLVKIKFEDKFHFHCLRHTFITNMLNAGVPIVKVKEIAGHSDIKTTMRYAHISSIDKEAMEVIRV